MNKSAKYFEARVLQYQFVIGDWIVQKREGRRVTSRHVASHLQINVLQ